MQSGGRSATDDGLQVWVTTDVPDQAHRHSLHIPLPLLQHLPDVLEAVFPPDDGEGDGLAQLQRRESVTDGR